MSTRISDAAVDAAMSATFADYRADGDVVGQINLPELLGRYGAHHAVDEESMMRAILEAARPHMQGETGNPITTPCFEAAEALSAVMVANQERKALSAHPSPGGQGDALLEEVARFLDYSVGHDPWPNIRRAYGDAWWEPVRKMRDDLRALAARQPVGEPFGWWLVDDNGIGRLSRTPPPDTIEIYRNTPGYMAIQLYTAPPAQAVDLNKLRLLGERIEQVGRNAAPTAQGSGNVYFRNVIDWGRELQGLVAEVSNG